MRKKWLHSIKNAFYNFTSRITHQLSPEEISLIKKTHLFDKLDEKTFAELLRSVTLDHYQGNDLILKEGRRGDDFYIIYKGSVRIFTRGPGREKISLARLNKGDYFGEQALLGRVRKSRSASVEAITPTILLKINESFIVKLLKIDTQLELRLRKMGNQQILNKLSATLTLHQSIITYLHETAETNIISLPPDELIFSAGDKPDFVYFILEGTIAIYLNADDKQQTILLKQGHLFGELGAISDTPRSGSAKTIQPTQLARIEVTKFQEFHDRYPQLQQLLKSLKNTYILPSRGLVQQYTGKLLDMNTHTTIYRLEDGHTVIASTALDKDFFSMTIEDVFGDKQYTYEKDANHKVEIKILDHHITSIKCYGAWEDLPKVCLALLDKIHITSSLLVQFTNFGNFETERSLTNDNMACECMSVSRQTVCDLIEAGERSLGSICKKTGACNVCSACRPRILEMLGQSNWISALLIKNAELNSKVSDYYLKNELSRFNAVQPGEFITLQIRVKGNWIERSYMISDIDEKGFLHITIKKEEHGIFTSWLFSHNASEIPIYASQPQGDFILDQTAKNPLLCIAYDIGISPFLYFAKALQQQMNQRSLHILYIVNKPTEFIFTNEFKQIANYSTAITIQYWAESESGRLSTIELTEILHRLKNPSIYICGPEGFENEMTNALSQIPLENPKIHIERLIHVSPPPEAAKSE